MCWCCWSKGEETDQKQILEGENREKKADSAEADRRTDKGKLRPKNSNHLESVSLANVSFFSIIDETVHELVWALLMAQSAACCCHCYGRYFFFLAEREFCGGKRWSLVSKLKVSMFIKDTKVSKRTLFRVRAATRLNIPQYFFVNLHISCSLKTPVVGFQGFKSVTCSVGHSKEVRS